MADERLVTVKSSGGDYTSLAAAIAGEAGNLVAADEWLHIECYAMTDITEAHITGFTTSSDCRIVVDTPLSERHQGVWDSNKYNLKYSIGNGIIKVSQSHVLLEGLQVWSTPPYHQIYNCLALNSPYGFGIRGTIAYNCTAVDCGKGFNQMWTSVTAYNCLSTGSSDSDYGSAVVPANLTLYNCASGDSSATSYAGSNNRANQTFTFKDAAHGDYHLAEGDTGARGYGAVNPGSGLYLDDVDGQLRGASWDIGFDQYVGATPPPSGMQKWYYHTQTMRG